ncbi:uncharacterized protein SOCE26_063320 [Sorangium cellulosum]|uniref:histidine kinase n=1 Tax=Sorangium cellulosum TaxID=56 RepID=A0A2L0EZW6_SORCE|nr:uncharacterized protein SOCE26_063320 [Sorangium cellulosum]
MTAYLQEGLQQDAGVLLLVTEERWAGLQRRLPCLRADATDAGRDLPIRVLDAQQVRDRVFVDGVLNERLFRRFIDAALGAVRRRAPGGRVCAYGELVDMLWREGHAKSAVQVERLWNEALSGRAASLLCAYHTHGAHGAHGAMDASAMELICHTHAQVSPAESFLHLETDEERSRAVSLLQHRAGATSELAARKAAEDALRSRQGELAEQARQRDQSIAVLGHELRNPLTAILCALRLARSGKPDAVERAVALAERQVRKMSHLIEDLLDVTRLSHGKIRLQREPIEVARCVEQAVEAIRPLLAARRQRLSLALPAEPTLLLGDPVRVEQILSNLLHNASKYTPDEGEIALRAGVVEGMVELAVQDTGRGMTTEFIARVFEPFAQSEPWDAGSGGGLGLGLSLVRELVELHGGSVRAHSDGLGRGSTFVVRLPLPAEASIPTSRMAG